MSKELSEKEKLWEKGLDLVINMSLIETGDTDGNNDERKPSGRWEIGRKEYNALRKCAVYGLYWGDFYVGKKGILTEFPFITVDEDSCLRIEE